MLCVPVDNEEMLNVALPFEIVLVPRMDVGLVLVSLNWTRPSVVEGVTVAVSEIDWPNVDGLCDEETVTLGII